VVRSTLSAAVGRVREARVPVAEAAAAAGIAWFIAHDLLGHPQPFFAPIAATVSMSTSPVRRFRRSVQMVAGVLLGIGVSELLHPLIGNSTLAIAAVVLLTLAIAVAVGAGLFAEGMMFVNQAAASAILVVTLHRAGTGGERATDALVGGAVALAIGVVLLPADPMKLLWQAEDGVLRVLAGILANEPPAGDAAAADWALAASQSMHERLAALTAARQTARSSVRVAPRRMRERGRVDAEERRVTGIYLLANATLGLVRTVADAEQQGFGADPRREVAELASAVRALPAAARPWSTIALIDTRRRLERMLAAPLPQDSVADTAVSVAARRVARDLLAVLPAGTGS